MMIMSNFSGILEPKLQSALKPACNASAAVEEIASVYTYARNGSYVGNRAQVVQSISEFFTSQQGPSKKPEICQSECIDEYATSTCACLRNNCGGGCAGKQDAWARTFTAGLQCMKTCNLCRQEPAGTKACVAPQGNDWESR